MIVPSAPITVGITVISIIIINIIIIVVVVVVFIVTPGKFFTPALVSGLSLESEWL